MTVRASFKGNIGRDCETKTVGENKVTKFSVADTSGYGDKKTTQWITCSLWGARGDKLAQYLTKGTNVLVYGDITTHAYMAKDGTAKADMTCRVTEIELLGGKKDGEGKSDESPSYKAQSPASSGGASFEDDIPFARLNDFQH